MTSQDTGITFRPSSPYWDQLELLVWRENRCDPQEGIWLSVGAGDTQSPSKDLAEKRMNMFNFGPELNY